MSPVKILGCDGQHHLCGWLAVPVDPCYGAKRRSHPPPVPPCADDMGSTIKPKSELLEWNSKSSVPNKAMPKSPNKWKGHRQELVMERMVLNQFLMYVGNSDMPTESKTMLLAIRQRPHDGWKKPLRHAIFRHTRKKFQLMAEPCTIRSPGSEKHPTIEKLTTERNKGQIIAILFDRRNHACSWLLGLISSTAVFYQKAMTTE